MYSHQEIEAYRTQFPLCEHPVNRHYKDGSCGCWCPFGAYGRENQEIDLNISDSCYECSHFKVRENPRKDIEDKDYEDYKVFVLYKNKMEKLKGKFGD